jgi:uncharacterized protein YqjF (DUF2071 family)
MIDRLSIRTRPSGWPVMYQTWGKLLFVHWPVAAEVLQPLLASGLRLDTFEGRAWVSVLPFTMWGIRPLFFPPLPVLSQSHELNVRTYVHVEGIPGVWCFSLDASNALAVFGARLSLGLPYFRAHMRLQEHHHLRRRSASGSLSVTLRPSPIFPPTSQTCDPRESAAIHAAPSEALPYPGHSNRWC